MMMTSMTMTTNVRGRLTAKIQVMSHLLLVEQLLLVPEEVLLLALLLLLSHVLGHHHLPPLLVLACRLWAERSPPWIKLGCMAATTYLCITHKGKNK